MVDRSGTYRPQDRRTWLGSILIVNPSTTVAASSVTAVVRDFALRCWELFGFSESLVWYKYLLHYPV